jgi:hypothetical protein
MHFLSGPPMHFLSGVDTEELPALSLPSFAILSSDQFEPSAWL